MEKQDLHFYMNWLKEQLLNYTNNGFLQASCRCLQLLLRIDPYRYETAVIDLLCDVQQNMRLFLMYPIFLFQANLCERTRGYWNHCNRTLRKSWLPGTWSQVRIVNIENCAGLTLTLFTLFYFLLLPGSISAHVLFVVLDVQSSAGR